ncbi:unnamed protein product [Adineta ricciae]|uniref:SAM domain-containing protein n=1 Tax=Adineta ricciae TaxID=249248 RepID=A0A815YZA8_ADIRI|nr:unnamed protein product [Adineta ricciae]
MANSIDEKSIEDEIDYETSSVDTSMHSEHVNKSSHSFSESTSNNSNDQLMEPNLDACQFQTDKQWLNCQYHDNEKKSIKKPNELENEMQDPPKNYSDDIFDRIQGSIFGMAAGDALGAHVEFRPREYLVQNPVEDLRGGGTWGLEIGQFTDDTSMALCLANSLIARADFVPYDQLVRYKWWYRHGYMSSTGTCFDIGAATRESLEKFENRQRQFAKENNIPLEHIDSLSHDEFLKNFNVLCSEDGVAGNGALMRLAPVPLFFYKDPVKAVLYSGISGQITHGDRKAYDACRYYGALIVAALHGETKEQLLDNEFYEKHQDWFQGDELQQDVLDISKGSYKKQGGYDDGIRGKGYIVNALEAALWTFWADENSFRKGACAAVNLGDDTDTTAAIYGQLAGAYYGYRNLPSEWTEKIYAKKFLEILSKWIAYEGQRWTSQLTTISILSKLTSALPDVSIEKPQPSASDSESEPKVTNPKIPVEEIQATDKTDESTFVDIEETKIHPSQPQPEVLRLSSGPDKSTSKEPDPLHAQPPLEESKLLTDEPTIVPEMTSTLEEAQPLVEEPESPLNESQPLHADSKPIIEEIQSQPEVFESVSETPRSSAKQEPEVSFETPLYTSSSSSLSKEWEAKPEAPKQASEQVKTIKYEYKPISPEPIRSSTQFISTSNDSNRQSNYSETAGNHPQFPMTLPVHYTSTIKQESSRQTDNMRNVPVNYQPNLFHGNDRRYNERQDDYMTNGTNRSSHTYSNFSSPKRPLYQGPNLACWTEHDVYYWIDSMGPAYKTYAERFQAERVDGYGLFRYVGEKLLLEFGIYNEEHKNKILTGIATLKSRLGTKH